MKFFDEQLPKLKDKLTKVKREVFDIEEKIRAIEDINYLVTTFGLVCDFLPASMEDWENFEHLFNPYLDGYSINPITTKYDRRWVGYHELTEYDHLQDWILPRWYEFKDKVNG